MCVRKVYVPPLNRMTSGRNGGLKMLYSTLMLMMSSAFLMLRLSPGGSFPRPLSEAEERKYLAPVYIEPDSVVCDDGAESLRDIAHFDCRDLIVQYGHSLMYVVKSNTA